jgi:hypothetical protein
MGAFCDREEFKKKLTKYIEDKTVLQQRIRKGPVLNTEQLIKELDTINNNIVTTQNNLKLNTNFIEKIKEHVKITYNSELEDLLTIQRSKEKADKTIEENLKRSIRINREAERQERTERTPSFPKRINKVKVLCLRDKDCQNFKEKCEHYICKSIAEIKLDKSPSRSTKQFNQQAAEKSKAMRRHRRTASNFNPLNP